MSLTISGLYTQKAKKVHYNLNEGFLSSRRPVIEQAFRSVLDEAPKNFQAQAAQAIKNGFGELNSTLKGKRTHLMEF